MNPSKSCLVTHLKKKISDERVIKAIEIVPRENFVPNEYKHKAYVDKPMPIGYGQTISQPSIVAIMLQELETRKTDLVLEIGTGSGYQTALLSNLVSKVITLERIPELAESARNRLEASGYTNVQVIVTNDQVGWAQDAPYDAIVVSAGVPKLPHSLICQLSHRGRLIIPVGSMETQDLMKVSRTDQHFSVDALCHCRFVPLIGEGGWPEPMSIY